VTEGDVTEGATSASGMVLLRIEGEANMISIDEDISLRAALNEVLASRLSQVPGSTVSLWVQDSHVPGGRRMLELHQSARQQSIEQFATVSIDLVKRGDPEAALKVPAISPTLSEVTVQQDQGKPEEFRKNMKQITEVPPDSRLAMHAARAAAGINSMQIQDLVNDAVLAAEEASTLPIQGAVDSELLEKVFAMTRCCSCIKQQAAAIRHLKASGQPELMIDLTESIRKKQEAAAEMQQLLNRYFLGQRLIPVGPLSMNYAEFLGNLTMHQRLSQLLSAEKAEEDAGFSEQIDSMLYNLTRRHLPQDIILQLVSLQFIPP